MELDTEVQQVARPQSLPDASIDALEAPEVPEAAAEVSEAAGAGPAPENRGALYQTVLDTEPEEDLLAKLLILSEFACSGSITVTTDEAIGVIFLEHGDVIDGAVTDGPWMGQGLEAVAFLTNLEAPRLQYSEEAHFSNRVIYESNKTLTEKILQVRPLLLPPKESPETLAVRLLRPLEERANCGAWSLTSGDPLGLRLHSPGREDLLEPALTLGRLLGNMGKAYADLGWPAPPVVHFRAPGVTVLLSGYDDESVARVQGLTLLLEEPPPEDQGLAAAVGLLEQIAHALTPAG